MKKLYKNIFLFLLPIALLWFIFPIDKKLKYEGLKEDCMNRGAWLFERIFKNKKTTDIIFLGSSHTINGVDDEFLQQYFYKKQTTVVNFGYCRLGRNFSYMLLKEILKTKKTKKIFLEVRENEDRYSHPIFPHLAETEDVVFAHLFFNRDYLSDLSTHFAYLNDQIQTSIYEMEEMEKKGFQDHGFTTPKDTADLIFLDKIKNKRAQLKSQSSQLEKDFYASFARGYLEKINTLCLENQVELNFLYLPSFGNSHQTLEELETYKKYGEVYFPPYSIFKNPNNWHDENHLNQSGAKELSVWLAKQIEEKRFQ